MKIELHLTRQYGIKIPERDRAGINPLTGKLSLRNHWVTNEVNLPALVLSGGEAIGGEKILAILYEPRLVGLNDHWLRFTGYEIKGRDGERQLVVQDWRCHVAWHD